MFGGCYRLFGGCCKLFGGCYRLFGGCYRLFGGCYRLFGGCYRLIIGLNFPSSKQIYLVMLRPRRLTQASFLQKKSNVAKCFFDICNAEMAQSLSSLEKSEFLKLIISFFHYFWCQNWDQWHKMSGKNTHIYFFYGWFKNKRVWAEKIRKKQKIPKT